MNKEKVVEEIRKRLDLTKAGASKTVDTVLDVIQEGTIKDGEVSFMNFGKFVVVERGARKGRNPQTGEALEIPAAYMPHFTAGRGFKEIVNK